MPASANVSVSSSNAIGSGESCKNTYDSEVIITSSYYVQYL